MGAYLSRVTEYAIPCLIFWGVLAISVAYDRSRFRNVICLLFAVLTTAPLFCVIAGSHERGAARALAVLALMVLMWVPVVLSANGVIMYRREGHSLANLLSLLLGLVVAVGEVCTFLFFIFPYFWAEDTAEFVSAGMRAVLFVSLTVTYGSVIFAAFMIYTVLLTFIPYKRDFDYVIIHGAGLIKGQKVSKLLADRIDKAIEVYRKDPTPPVLIPSGGRGSDEDLAEAEAMEQYLLEHGIPRSDIIREDRSATTRENLIFSKKIIDGKGGSGHTALVTSNYHVYRALSICREIGLECTGIGAHVAPYYWPSAVIREFAAIIMSNKLYLLLFAAGWAACVLPAMKIIMPMVGQ